MTFEIKQVCGGENAMIPETDPAKGFKSRTNRTNPDIIIKFLKMYIEISKV